MKRLIPYLAIATAALTGHTNCVQHQPESAGSRASLPLDGKPGLGERIAFTRVQEDINRPGSDFRLEAEIWVMNGDGTEPRRITHNTTDDLGAAWSPDGKKIAFGSNQFGPDGQGGLVLLGQRIFLIDAAGGQQSAMTDSTMRAQFPSWSPDGKKIAFHGSRGRGPAPPEIFLMNSDGSGVQQLTDNTWADARADWSPDGKRIVFQSNRDGTAEIYVMNADGSAPIQLTFNEAPVANQAPDWSPDGRRFVFQSNRDGNFEIYVMNADGTGQARLTNHPGRDLDPDWSPDGRKIAFDRDISPIEQQIRELFVMNVDGTRLTPLTTLPSKNGHAAWTRGRVGR